MKKILLLILASVAVSLYARSAEPETEDLVPYYKYRVYLKDKGRRTASLMKHPERYLSARSIERRAKQGLAIEREIHTRRSRYGCRGIAPQPLEQYACCAVRGHYVD